ncbi:WD40 repeat domain-containing protein [Streptomyces sp. NPDC006134]|uniref:WD40 repeat domain-containing protein n=1 Tax=Streptomyces sp. NPDC006134 TaxID=3154467 RepID=UPI0033C0D737
MRTEPRADTATAVWPHLDSPLARAAQSLLSWAADSGDVSGSGDSTPRTAVVIGPPGAGKSRLLASFVAGVAKASSDPRITVHAVGLAAGQVVQTLAWQIGRHLGYGPVEPDELLRRLGADPRPVLLVVTDLHRSGRGPADLPAARPGAVVDNLITPLRALANVRMIVESDTPELLGAEDLLIVDMPSAPDASQTVAHADAHSPAPPGEAATPLLPGSDWRAATPDEREHALDRALAAGTAHELLRDPGYLVYGSVPAITAALADPRIPQPPGLRAIWAEAAPALSAPDLPDVQRAAILHTASVGMNPRLAEYLRPLAEASPWMTRWSLPTRTATALALLPAGTAPDTSGGAFVSADSLGRLTQYALTGGQALAPLPSGTAWQPAALGPVSSDCLLALDRSGTLRLLPLTPDAPAPIGLGSLMLHHNAASLAAPPDFSDRPTAVAVTARYAAVGDGRGRVHLWPLGRPVPEPGTFQPHRSAVTGVACLEVDNTLLVVTGGLDGTVALWDSVTAEPMKNPVERRNALPTAPAVADTDAGPVLAVAWSDRRLHLCHLLSGRMTALPVLSPVHGLALTSDAHLLIAGREGIRLIKIDLTTLWARREQ